MAVVFRGMAGSTPVQSVTELIRNRTIKSAAQQSKLASSRPLNYPRQLVLHYIIIRLSETSDLPFFNPPDILPALFLLL